MKTRKGPERERITGELRRSDAQSGEWQKWAGLPREISLRMRLAASAPTGIWAQSRLAAARHPVAGMPTRSASSFGVSKSFCTVRLLRPLAHNPRRKFSFCVQNETKLR